VHYFVTGHTGFKGSWLIVLLKALGHTVSGYALTPPEGGLFVGGGLESDLYQHTIGDIRNQEKLQAALSDANPDVVIHLAAQPLVLRSYEDPIETYTTNVNGTLNLLEAVTSLSTQPTLLVVTTDKVYKDTGKGVYSESDPLGGHDPYSASKAMADILTQSWAATHENMVIHVARAGNVIGAFDVSQNRLIPDIKLAIESNVPLVTRHPDAVRPWQHVLDCLSGYLAFIDAAREGVKLPVALNFGPDPEGLRAVSDVIATASVAFPTLQVQRSSSETPKETSLLTLDSGKAKAHLGWANVLGFEESVLNSLFLQGGNYRSESFDAADNFLRLRQPTGE